MLSLGSVKESPKEEKLKSGSCRDSATLTACMDLSMHVQNKLIVNPHHPHDLAPLLFQPQILTVRWPCST